MGKFHYCNNKDELDWSLPLNHTNGIRLPKSSIGSKSHFKEWITTKCTGDVWGWNGCETPTRGETNYGHKVMPSGDITLFFEKDSDKHKLLIQHCDKIDYGV